ncbi:MAG: DUF3788 domain-containing protein [Thermoproteota archaeon]
MYERMLNRDVEPSLADMRRAIGVKGTRLLAGLDGFLRSHYDVKSEIRFPFGSGYGWGIKYSHRSKHLCYVFPEKDAFTVTIQIGRNELPRLNMGLSGFSRKTKRLWENRYPCGEGGWVHYRVLSKQDLKDVEELIKIKKPPVKPGAE